MKMIDELFPTADVAHDSPRLAWIKRHGVSAIKCAEIGLADASIGQWAAWAGEHGKRAPWSDYNPRKGYGETEEDAIADLADLLGIPLWNEEEFAATTAQQRTTKTT